MLPKQGPHSKMEDCLEFGMSLLDSIHVKGLT